MEYDLRVYWLWLQHALGAGSSKAGRILSSYPTVYDFYRAGRQSWLLEGYFTQKELRNMEAWTAEQAAALLEYSEKMRQRVITPDDSEYPELLKQISNPPCALYVKGHIPDISCRPSIAIVGTRKATATGRTAARSIAYELAKKGAVVVSGGALGIDTAAHKGALQAGGKTVCVLGCGIDANYLMVNASLRDVIAQNGALVSEYPPDTQPLGSNFPIRNRIISGLAVGTLVVEAASHSGSLITADCALDQGRDVFAVPADIYSPVSKGVNSLIKCGAKPVSSAGEILEEYSERFLGKILLDGVETNAIIKDKDIDIPKKPHEENHTHKPENLSDDAERIYSVLSKEPAHISNIEAETGLPVQCLLAALTELELAGVVRSYSGRRYGLC
mgnify:FL=1|jgi:DNA processing protein